MVPINVDAPASFNPHGLPIMLLALAIILVTILVTAYMDEDLGLGVILAVSLALSVIFGARIVATLKEADVNRIIQAQASFVDPIRMSLPRAEGEIVYMSSVRAKRDGHIVQYDTVGFERFGDTIQVTIPATYTTLYEIPPAPTQ